MKIRYIPTLIVLLTVVILSYDKLLKLNYNTYKYLYSQNIL